MVRCSAFSRFGWRTSHKSMYCMSLIAGYRFRQVRTTSQTLGDFGLHRKLSGTTCVFVKDVLVFDQVRLAVIFLNRELQPVSYTFARAMRLIMYPGDVLVSEFASTSSPAAVLDRSVVSTMLHADGLSGYGNPIQLSISCLFNCFGRPPLILTD